jgi:hypothetical protein
MILGVAGLRPNFFSSGRIFLAELAQESWRDLAAVVHRATCSFSIALYKQWYTLADFLPNWNFRGVFFKYHFYRWKYQRSCDSRGPYIFLPRWSCRRLHWGPYCDFSRDFSIYYSPDGTSKAAMGGAWPGAGKDKEDIIYLGCQIA